MNSNNYNQSHNQYWNQFEEDFDLNTTQRDVKTNLTQNKELIDEHLELILKLKDENNLFRLLTASLCPQIYGNQLIKASLVLSLFCGNEKYDKEYKQMIIRDKIHVLIIGNHGSDKHLLLKSVNNIANKSHYIIGNTSTFTLLTAKLINEKHKKIIKKGPLLSANNGICCINDFDKMNLLEHQALEEVMRFMTYSFIKKGVVHKFSTKTTIIATANPMSGLYDDSKNVWENISAKTSVLSCFDLIFVLQDTPDQQIDSKLSEEVIANRCNARSNTQDSQFSQSFHSSNRSFGSQSLNVINNHNLMSKLIFGPEEEEEESKLIDHQLFKKYVIYAQKYIHPVISSEARILLNEFSLKMAKTEICKSQTLNLELLYRLAESRAKVELRSIVTKEDAFDVIDIIKHTIDKQFLMTNNDFCFSNSIPSMSGSSKRAKTQNLFKALKIVSQQTQQNVFSVQEIIEICFQFKIPFAGKEDIMETIDRLNEETVLLKNNSNYKLNA